MTAALAMKVCPTCKASYGGGEVFCPVDATRLVTGSQVDMRGPDPEDPLVGTVLAGRYKVLKRIGEGGMGLVYIGEHTIIEKRVAIKVLREDFSRRPEVVERFRQEAKSASRIGHENIVDISDFGETPSGASYFVMEYLDGEDLADQLEREVALPVDRAARIVLQCCKALGAAHAKGIVHRDMKPENIFMVRREDGRDFVKIVDFGIAKMSDIETDGAPGRKLTKTGMIFGTPEYMSPEQAAGKHLDHRVDVYALGVILYELITGRVPFIGDSFMGILTQHMFEEPPPLREANAGIDCSPEIEAVIFRALAKEPGERYGSMDELGHAIEEALAGRGAGTLVGYGEPVKARRQPPRAIAARDATEGFEREATGKPVALIAAGVAVLLALGGGAAYVATGGFGTAAAPAPPEPPRVAAPAPVPEPVAAPTPEPAAEPEPAPVPVPEPAGPRLVEVTVETRPAGAELSVDGGDGCPATPCTILAAAGEPLRLTARLGRAVGSTELVPTEARSVEIALTAHHSRESTTMRRSASSDTATMTGASGGGSGDLKIPDIFR